MSRRAAAMAVGVAIAAVGSAAAAAVTGSAGTPPAPSRDERVARAERTMWDRYGPLDPTPTVSGTEAQALVDMIAHHTDAIDGSITLLAQDAIDERVEALASRLIRVQREQVATMEGWLAEWYPSSTAASSWVPMFGDPHSLASPSAFLSTMIEHHQHAISMYAGWVASGTVGHHDLGLLAARIAKGQEGEIAYMLQLRSAIAQPAS
jgi:uncharacterized protein (DUF305 family)